jgi:hypothetical protein
MMKSVGMLGFSLGALLIALAVGQLLQDVVGPLIKADTPESVKNRDMILKGIGWGVAGVVWLAFAYVTNFSLGSWVLAFLYLMHALVGYVELGTDGWITNVTNQVLKNETNATLAFIWTNVLMCFLRFFAGPIVHKINPIGLLFASAALGTIGLYLLGNPSIDSVWPWMVAVTIYGLGKTFYWPTLLGVISERFPKGGALALGISGGVGMIGAGVLGIPGIGYKQDYFAVQKLEESPEGQATYQRYMARNDKGEPDKKGFPYVTELFPKEVPKVAGIDNAKFKVFEDYTGILARIEAEKKADKEPPRRPAPGLGGLEEYINQVDQSKLEGKAPPNVALTTLESDLVTLLRLKRENKPVEKKLENSLTERKKWWDTAGYPKYEVDKEPLVEARLDGAKTALLVTALVPLALAVGFVILIAYFYFTGGYKQVHLDETPPPTGEY